MPIKLRPQLPSCPVVRARIFPNGAVVTRRAEISWAREGPLQFDLPLGPEVHPRSVQAFVFTAGEDMCSLPCEVLAIRAPNPTRATQELAEAKDEARRQTLLRQAQWAKRSIETEWGQAEPNLNAWHDFLSLYERETGQIAHRREARKLEADRVQPPPQAQLRCEIPAQFAGPLIVEWSFPSAGAGWKQSYDLRQEGEELELVSVAHAFQNSLETWNEVQLTLDASPPLHLSAPPLLSPLLVSGFPGTPVVPGTITAPSPSAPQPQPQPIRAAGPVTLLGHGESLRIELFRRRLSAEVRCEAWLNGPLGAYRIAVGQAPCDISKATIRVFDEEGYRGQLDWPGCRRHDLLELPLGPDPQIKLQRKEGPKHQRSRPGNRLEHSFEGQLHLENCGPVRKDIDLKAKLPVAGSSDVDVRIGVLPSSMAVDSKTGIAEGIVRLPEGSQRSFDYAFSITAPRTVVVLPNG